MRSQIKARARASERRQRLQIGGGVLAVAAIWTAALWPSGTDQPSEPSTPPRSSLRPWTTGPFIGTTPPTGSSVRVTTSSTTTVPAVITAPPRVATSPVVRRSAPVTRTPVTTTSTSSKTAPTSRGNRPTRPPKP